MTKHERECQPREEVKDMASWHYIDPQTKCNGRGVQVIQAIILNLIGQA